MVASRVDALSDSLEDAHSERMAEACASVCSRFADHAAAGASMLGRVLAAEVRNVLLAGLFRHGWENSVAVVVAAQQVEGRVGGFRVVSWLDLTRLFVCSF